jgi:hypothetical protein
MLKIYWVMRPKSSVDPLLIIEANLILVRLGFSSIYTLFLVIIIKVIHTALTNTEILFTM